MSQVCFICSKPLAESEIVAVERGLKTLIDSGIERNDGYVEYLKDKQSMTIHVQYRKMYTRKTSIAVAKRQREMKVSTSSSSPTRTRARSGEPIYAPNSLSKLLTGHAYARAVRAHTLFHLT
ncbi:hypothetical protein AVEN_44199-1 [Araneus ventricosus]|uniref:Uncharacterized protein n=1 Tax=Araneus ventricosus TaxID=182803 RepID=A0A4Y2RC48_ARAVE|nr:hypothetical protein AVEN_44199-1 [Araneus ventricosus]